MARSSNITKIAGSIVALVGLGILTGCQSTSANMPASLTIFVDGAGNLGHGAENMKKGFAQAGFNTRVESFIWTSSFNPLIDQLNVSAAKKRSAKLADMIREFRTEQPEGQVNLVSFSAGTGVAVWACEQLDETTSVDNLVLLGSSLSHDYDISKAASNVNHEIVVYHSDRDVILGLVKVIGTIDGKRGIDAAGSVGLTENGANGAQLVNIEWDASMKDLGWSGGHDDAVAAGIAKYEIAPRLIASAFAAGDTTDIVVSLD